MINLTEKTIDEILNNIESYASYYIGGSLCVDGIVKNDVLIFNLNGFCNSFLTGEKKQLTKQQQKTLFKIYKKHKGETNYYKKEYLSFVN